MEQSAKENSCGELSYEEDDGRVVDAKVEQLSAMNEDSYVVTYNAKESSPKFEEEMNEMM